MTHLCIFLQRNFKIFWNKIFIVPYRPVARPIRLVVLNATCSKLQFLEKWFWSAKTHNFYVQQQKYKIFSNQKKKEFYYLKKIFSFFLFLTSPPTTCCLYILFYSAITKNLKKKIVLKNRNVKYKTPIKHIYLIFLFYFFIILRSQSHQAFLEN